MKRGFVWWVCVVGIVGGFSAALIYSALDDREAITNSLAVSLGACLSLVVWMAGEAEKRAGVLSPLEYFDKLEFSQLGTLVNHNAARVFFRNGYGVSVVRGSFARGDASAPYELAVLKGTEREWDLCYSTPITDDTVGYLTAFGVGELMRKVALL